MINILPQSQKRGYYLPLVLTLSVIDMMVTASILTLTYTNYSLVKRQTKSTSALNVAEAGINYYLWHLAKNSEDYCDGQSCTGGGPYGPYTHTYRDASGHVIGSYEITITPPVGSGTSVEVRVEGQTSTGEKRTVVATLGVPSFARYSFVSNSESWFGDTESTRGLVHSNRGIHFDGTADGLVTSATQTYIPTSCFGGNGSTVHNGVWGDGGPQNYWMFPVPQVDFNSITTDLSALKDKAITSSSFLPTLVDNKGKKTHSGYYIQLNANGTYRVGKVTGGLDNGGSSGCASHPRYTSLVQSISWESSSRPLPATGVIYAADNVWVSGVVDSKLTIASGRLPENASTYTNIFLQNDITYTAKDGHASLGLVSQSDIVVNSNSENDLEIDAFLLSQKGRVFRPYYSGNIKNQISIYGGVAAYSWWTWSWTSGSSTVSGYRNTIQEYDNHLALDPPPLFPKTGSFAILSWKEEPIL